MKKIAIKELSPGDYFLSINGAKYMLTNLEEKGNNLKYAVFEHGIIVSFEPDDLVYPRKSIYWFDPEGSIDVSDLYEETDNK